jgi:hypothetical protein
MVCKNNGKRIKILNNNLIFNTSGDYRKFFCYVELKNISKDDVFTLIPSTFLFNQYGHFSLQLESDFDHFFIQKLFV